MSRFDVFISYAHSDRSTAEALARALRARSFRVWFDRWMLKPGVSWQGELEAALTSSKAVLVLIGAEGIGPWAQRELAYGLDQQFRDPSFRIILVLGPGADPRKIPSLLRTLGFVDFRDLRPGTLDELAARLTDAGEYTSLQGGAPKVFLCHAAEDGARIEALYYALQDEGLDPWYDKKKLVVGDRWETEITHAIEQTDFFAIFLSHRSVRKTGYIQKEIRTAVQQYQRRPQDIAFLLPVRLEDCNVPRIKLDDNTFLPDLQWQDVFDGNQGSIREFAKGVWEQWNRTRNTAAGRIVPR